MTAQASGASAGPHSGEYAEAISNHAFGHLMSDYVNVSANTEYDLYAYVRGELDCYGLN